MKIHLHILIGLFWSPHLFIDSMELLIDGVYNVPFVGLAINSCTSENILYCYFHKVWGCCWWFIPDHQECLSHFILFSGRCSTQSGKLFHEFRLVPNLGLRGMYLRPHWVWVLYSHRFLRCSWCTLNSTLCDMLGYIRYTSNCRQLFYGCFDNYRLIPAFNLIPSKYMNSDLSTALNHVGFRLWHWYEWHPRQKRFWWRRVPRIRWRDVVLNTNNYDGSLQINHVYLYIINWWVGHCSTQQDLSFWVYHLLVVLQTPI